MVANLANYNFSIKYKSGKLNIEADALSRNPWGMQIETTIVKSIISQEGALTTTLFESYGPNTDLLNRELIIAKRGNANLLPPGLSTPAKTDTKITKEMWVEV